jgi:hypothetical protein
VSDIPRRAVTRSAKLATLPLGVAGRATLGLGKRLGGKPAEAVAAELQARTAEQLFQVLGQLKGGAMKFGQALSVFEAALPEEVAAPYRAALTRLQEAAPPLPAATVHKALASELGADWRASFASFDDTPAAAASIGQVHRAVWARRAARRRQDPVPGGRAGAARRPQAAGAGGADVRAISPGPRRQALLRELEERVAEELDYRLEAEAQDAFAAAYDGDPDIHVPASSRQRARAGHRVDRRARRCRRSSPTARSRSATTRPCCWRASCSPGPVLAGLLHADPHPGNFRCCPDGRLGVIDFGAVNRLPDGAPEPIGRLARLALEGDAEQVLAELRAEGFVLDRVHIDAQEVLDYLLPLLEPIAVERFRFTREWLRAQAVRIGDPRSPAAALGRQLNLPPSYLLIHRVTLGTIGVLCQLGGEAAFRAEMARWQPGFAEPGSAAAREAEAAGERRVDPPTSLPSAATTAIVQPPPDDTLLS